MALFGYDALDGKMIGIRDVFKMLKIYVGRINGNNAKGKLYFWGGQIHRYKR